MAEKWTAIKTMHLSQLFYNYLMALQETYGLDGDSEVRLHDTVLGAVEEIFPHILKQKVTEAELHPSPPAPVIIKKNDQKAVFDVIYL